MTQEKTRTRPRAGVGPAGGPWDDDPLAPPTPELATVSHGPYAQTLPVGGMTVAEVRRRFRDRLDLDPDCLAIVDGEEVGDDRRIGAGELVTFVRRAGEKGP